MNHILPEPTQTGWPLLQNLEMSGNLKPIREMSGNLPTVRELSGNKPCHGKGFQKLVVASWSCQLLHIEVMLKFIFWSLTLTLVMQACYKYHLTWARVPCIVREMSGNFAVSGEWSPCKEALVWHIDIVWSNLSLISYTGNIKIIHGTDTDMHKNDNIKVFCRHQTPKL